MATLVCWTAQRRPVNVTSGEFHSTMVNLAIWGVMHIDPHGFREYDARWRIGVDIDLAGVAAVGRAMATLMRRRGLAPEIVTGHDFRSYSETVKRALVSGLKTAGLVVHDLGLCLSPAAYFAQSHLHVAALAMVTASHNENGWTGLKLATEPGLTFEPCDMAELRDITFAGHWPEAPGGHRVDASATVGAYIKDLMGRHRFGRRLKLVVACGNGTAGAFAPQILAEAGADVIPLDCGLDWEFPNGNPNPEDPRMSRRLAAKVVETRADLGLAFDGDGDRCGFVDGMGRAISADKMGLLLARDLAVRVPAASFIVDIKSTGLFGADPELLRHGARVEYWKTGHSYMKRRLHEAKATAAFEKSGHFFFNAPVGRGYDDAILAALETCALLARAPGLSLAQLYDALPRTWITPTLSPVCPDAAKYGAIERITQHYARALARAEPVCGHGIASIETINGVRFTLQDGSWGLVRASSNQPQLTVVCESPVSEAMMHAVLREIGQHLSTYEDVGALELLS